MIEMQPTSSASLWERASLVTASAVAAGLLLSACSSPPEEYIPAEPSVTNPAGPSDYDRYVELPKGPCRPAYAETKYADTEKEARICLTAYTSGKIALVDFTASPERAQKIAKEMTTAVKHSTNKLVHPTVEVVPASAAAQKELKRVNAAGCINDGDPLSYGSVVADKTMSQLRTADFVIALDSMLPCSANEDEYSVLGGIADQSKGRHAEIFSANLDRKGSKIPQGVVGAHEFGHEIGLGHHSEAFCGKEGESKSDLYGNNPPTSPRRMDLRRYLQTCEFSEYSRSMGSLMGDSGKTAPKFVHLNPIHQEALRWPLEALGKTTSHAQRVGRKWTTIQYQAAEDGSFTSVKLPKPFSFPKQSDEVERQFDTLNIIPQVGNGSNVAEAAVYLSSDEGAITDLGILGVVDPGSEPKTWRLQYDEKVVDVKLDGHSMQVREEQTA